MSGALGPAPRSAGRGSLREVAGLFARLGLTAFGGPAAHVALMRREVVERRGWMDDRRFLDLLAAASLLPGPTSTELAIILGGARAGRRGLVVAGALFILPAMTLTLAFAWAYVAFGGLAPVQSVLYGVKPVIIAIVAHAIVGLAGPSIRRPLPLVAAAVAAVLAALGVDPLVPLLGIPLLLLLFHERHRVLPSGWTLAALPLGWGGAAAVAGPVGLLTLFGTLLKIGATLYGSGYVLLAFLREDFVVRLGWLTERQLLDAVAVGQLTPGPVFTTATFIGYLVAGWAGAIVATAAIFLPSFVFVAALGPLLPRLVGAGWTRPFLDGASAAAIGLMAAVGMQLALTSIVDLPSAVLALAALVLLLRLRVGSAWLVLGGGLAGLLLPLRVP